MSAAAYYIHVRMLGGGGGGYWWLGRLALEVKQ